MIIVLLSGGIDSTYALWVALQSGERVIAVHYRDMKERATEKRGCPETMACAKIVEELHKLGYEFEYEVAQFSLPYNDNVHEYFLPTMTLLPIIHRFKGQKIKLYLGDSFEDNDADGQKNFMNGLDGQHGWKYFIRIPQIMAPLYYTLIDPFAQTPLPEEWEIGMEQSKADKFAALPDSVSQHCWGCEEFTKVNGEYFPCGRCYRCEVYNAARN